MWLELTQTLQSLVISAFKDFDQEVAHDCLCQHQLSCSEQIRVGLAEDFWMESSLLCVCDSPTDMPGSIQLALHPSLDVSVATLSGKAWKFDAFPPISESTGQPGRGEETEKTLGMQIK